MDYSIIVSIVKPHRLFVPILGRAVCCCSLQIGVQIATGYNNMTTLATKPAASKLQISPNTLRNWSEQYSQFLSPSAQPGVQPERRFTEKDLTILTYIKQLRSEGLQVAEITERLSETSFQETEILEATTEAIQPASSGSIALQTTPEGLQQAPAPIVGQDYLLSIERRFEALERSVKEEMRPRWWWLVAGIGIGIGLAVVFELMALVVNKGH